MKRRSFVTGTLSAGAAGLAVGAGLLSPATLFAADEAKQAEDAKQADQAKPDQADAGAPEKSGFDMKTVDAAEESDAVKLKAPEIAENGAVVPVTVDATGVEGATEITLVAAKNPDPLTGVFHFGEGALAYASTRIKMGKTGDVIALVKAGDKTVKAVKNVKVTIGGCGG